MRAPGIRSVIGLLLTYLALGALAALVYRSALGGLTVVAAAVGLLVLALGVAWATSARRSPTKAPPHG